MKRLIIAVIAVLIVAAGVYGSWHSISVSSSGNFTVQADGTIRYTHQLTNLTWHPVRYVVAADPASPVRMELIKATSSMEDRTVTRMQPSETGVPWSVTVTVPGHQVASVVVDFRPAESLTDAKPEALTDMGGSYPTVTVSLRIDR